MRRLAVLLAAGAAVAVWELVVHLVFADWAADDDAGWWGEG